MSTANSHGLVLGLALLLVVCARRPAGADDTAAEAAFREGRRLAREGRFAEACPHFEASHRAAPALGALLNLAICHEKIGRTASAYTGYRAAQEMARVRVDPREAVARDLADRLAPRLVRLRVELAGPMAHGLVVRRGPTDITDALGVAAAVDPGEHVIEASAPGHVTWVQAVTVIREGETVAVQVPALRRDLEGTASDAGSTPADGQSTDGMPPSACGSADFQLVLANRANGLRLAVGAGGDAVLAWSEQGRVTAAEYSATGGRWAPAPLVLPRGTTPESLTVAVGRRGDALAATSTGTLAAARRAERDSWVARTTRDAVARQTLRSAIDDAGNALLVWVATGSGSASWSVRSRRFTANGQRWEPSVPLSGPTTTGQPAVLAMRGDGDAVVLWRESDERSTRLVARRFSAIAGTWGAPHEVDQATALSEPTAAFDGRGDLVVSWNEYREARRHLLAAVVSTDQRWSAVHVLATDVGHPDPPALTAGPGGSVTALWRQGASPDVWGSRWVSSTWREAAVVIPRDGGAGPLKVAADEHGNAVAAWPRCGTSACRIETARRDADDDEWWRVGATFVSRAAEPALSLAVGASQARAFVAWQSGVPAAICVARIW